MTFANHGARPLAHRFIFMFPQFTETLNSPTVTNGDIFAYPKSNVTDYSTFFLLLPCSYPEFVMGPPPRRVPSIQMLPASLSAEMEATAPLLQAAASSAATANAAAAPSSSKQQYPRSLPITRRFEQVRRKVGHGLRESRLLVKGVNFEATLRPSFQLDLVEGWAKGCFPGSVNMR